MFDPESYGRQVQHDPRTIPDVFRLWRADHPQDAIDVFSGWIESVTGSGMFDLLEEEEARGLLSDLALDANLDEDPASDDALMVFEGLESGP